MKLHSSQKTENRLKAYSEKVHHENYVKLPIIHKQNWQVKSLNQSIIL